MVISEWVRPPPPPPGLVGIVHWEKPQVGAHWHPSSNLGRSTNWGCSSSGRASCPPGLLSGETPNLASLEAGSDSLTIHVMSKQMAHYYRTVEWAKDYLGGRCAKCDSVDGLQFDHIDRALKEFEISRMFRNRSRKSVILELDKCQLLCADHHREKTSEEMGVEHGGGLSGKKNCKCDPCRKRKNEYMREWKRNRKPASIAQLVRAPA